MITLKGYIPDNRVRTYTKQNASIVMLNYQAIEKQLQI